MGLNQEDDTFIDGYYNFTDHLHTRKNNYVVSQSGRHAFKLFELLH